MSVDHGVASLPMYDWPELRQSTDAYWAAIRDSLREARLRAPDNLTRTGAPEEQWLNPALCLSQTCGLPYATRLRDKVTLLGVPDYGIPELAPGHYQSVIIVRRKAFRGPVLGRYRGSKAAINDWRSQSGFAAFCTLVQANGLGPDFLAGSVVSGSHDLSARCVASSKADIAAIDAISWQYIKRFRDYAGSLRVLTTTDPTPGLPLIAGPGIDPEPVVRAIKQAINNLDPSTCEDLGLRGFQTFRPEDYDTPLNRLPAWAAAIRDQGTVNPEFAHHAL